MSPSLSFPSVEEGFQDFQRQHAAPKAGTSTAPGFELDLPSGSQFSLALLDSELRLPYGVTWAKVKPYYDAGQLPDWDAIALEELYRDAPTAVADRMKAHFDEIFRRCAVHLAADAAASNDLAQKFANLPATHLARHHGPVWSNVAADSSQETVPGCQTAAGALVSPRALVQEPDVSAAGPDVLTRPTGTGEGALSAESDGSVMGGPHASRDCQALGNDSAVERATFARATSSASLASSSVRRFVHSSGSKTSPGLPTLSLSASKAVRGVATGILREWRYCGLMRREPNGLLDEVPLTFDQARIETAQTTKKGKGADQFPKLRERWECLHCGKLRHEQVGSTTNLAKHTTKQCKERPTEACIAIL
ncbi:hypothetical protein V8E36_000549 [Tilletia maclaganii]